MKLIEIILARIDQDANEYRFYRLVLPPGSRALLRQWGRINEYINEKWDVFADRKSALEAYEKTEREKRHEGYTVADRSVFPKNYMFYHPQAQTQVKPDGQLSLFEDES